MNDWYDELKKLDGHNCYTLTQDKPAVMHVDDLGVTVEYPSGGSTRLSRELLNIAYKKLQIRGVLTLEDVHNGITNQQGAKTDR